MKDSQGLSLLYIVIDQYVASGGIKLKRIRDPVQVLTAGQDGGYAL